MKKWLLVLSCFFLLSAARAGRVTGTVTDEQGSILPYASIFVKAGSRGTTSSNSGHYFLDLPNGSYTLVCQYVGFSREEKKITITDSTLVVDFHLLQQQGTLKEVIVKPGGEDPAYDIIRHAIKKRRTYQFPLDSFTCEVYIKTLLKTNSLPGKIMGKTFSDQDRKDLGVDSVGKGIVYLSESVTRIGFRKPDKVKLEVISGRESGSNGFGFNFPTFIDFYDNNVNVFITQLSPRGYVSPIADGAPTRSRNYVDAGDAEVGVGCPVLVADLERDLAIEPAHDLPVVAGPAQRGIVLGGPVVEAASQVERAAGEGIGMAVGSERVGAGKGERQEGRERAKLH